MPDVLDDQAFQRQLQKVADSAGVDLQRVRSQALADLHEMQGKRNPVAVRLFAKLSRFLYRRGYRESPYYDTEELQKVRDLVKQRPVVFLVTHKTYLDFFVLFDFLYRHRIPAPFIFGGLNMNFAGFGALARRAGGIFIRRSFKDDPVYKAVLQRYIEYLVEQGSCFMWAIEGTRSRTGKLVMPKLGLLKYVVDASRRLADDAMIYVPVCVAYDQIPDVIDMAAQEAGATKKPESLAWFMDYVRGLGGPFGNIYIRFGDAVSLSDTPDAPDLTASQVLTGAQTIEVRKLAFEICYRINETTPATVSSLIMMSLLCRTEANAKQIRQDIRTLTDYITERQSSALLKQPSRREEDESAATLDALIVNGAIEVNDDDCGHTYCIAPRRYLVALYYSNMAVHHFVISAFAELGLLRVADPESESAIAVATFWSESIRLRDLFKFEFFFSRKDVFRRQLTDELGFLEGSWQTMLERGGEAAADVLRRRPLLVAHGVLSPFVNAYCIVAQCLLHAGPGRIHDEADFIMRCQEQSKSSQYGDTAGHSGLASKALLTNGLNLAKNRGLLDDVAHPGDARRAFADELNATAEQLEKIRRMTA